MVPVMLMNVIVNGRTYDTLEYICTLLIVLGVTLFSRKSAPKTTTKLQSPNMTLGYALCITNLLLDGWTSAFQDDITAAYPDTGPFDIMLGMNAMTLLFSLCWALIPVALTAIGDLVVPSPHGRSLQTFFTPMVRWVTARLASDPILPAAQVPAAASLSSFSSFSSFLRSSSGSGFTSWVVSSLSRRLLTSPTITTSSFSSSSSSSSSSSTSSSLLDTVMFVVSHPRAATDLGWMVVTSVLGQIFVFAIIADYGSLTVTTVTTTRKFFSILLSVVVNQNPLLVMQWMGVVAVFSGLSLKTFIAVQKSTTTTTNNNTDTSTKKKPAKTTKTSTKTKRA